MTRLAILGGLGHVGLPLGLVFADAGFEVALIDTNRDRIQTVRMGKMPFLEQGAEFLLKRHLGERVTVINGMESHASEVVRRSEVVIVTLGTPLDEYQNPRLNSVLDPVRSFRRVLDGQLIVLRSTVFPGTTERVARELAADGVKALVAYCPERILQGHAVSELRTLPQIVSGITPEAADEAGYLFQNLRVPIVRATVAEAELAKLGLNYARYVSFAVPNELADLALELGIDYAEVDRVMKEGYTRADWIPKPGFAAGPCLLKDTMQLVAASRRGMPLGQAAHFVNERTPETVMRQLVALHGSVEGATIGILGMAFKADNDDTRDSLSFQLKKRLEFAGARVLCSDECAPSQFDIRSEEWWRTKEEIMAECSGVVLCVPHSGYKGMVVPSGKVVVDLWGVTQEAPHAAAR